MSFFNTLNVLLNYEAQETKLGRQILKNKLLSLEKMQQYVDPMYVFLTETWKPQNKQRFHRF